MAFERFEKYTVEELAACGEAFSEAFTNREIAGGRGWTTAMLAWFGDCAAEGMAVYPGASGAGAFMLDHCHMDFPYEIEQWDDRYDQAIEQGRCHIRLALESEMGQRSKDPLSNKTLILQDAAKIACVRADVKVMLFASQKGKCRDALFTALSQLRIAAGDASPWLCIDIPWGLKQANIAWKVINRGGAVVAQA